MNSSGENLSDSMMPKHVAIIMDGNGRWAKQRGKLRITGHKAGVESVRHSVRFAVKIKLVRSHCMHLAVKTGDDQRKK
ncbi:Undecaprenyl pyrophosphate synthase [Providencia rettgeri]|uniref:Undecaprenyl pyrophosphate synthase n=1 Tax=Providencia rettgeri TaxID=587 RepID=A0A379FV72_PRORE|nr:Undecaprenyl pyrophosphate synthase [Providencia rettgeri]